MQYIRRSAMLAAELMGVQGLEQFHRDCGSRNINRDVLNQRMVFTVFGKHWPDLYRVKNSEKNVIVFTLSK
jgi:hypothetical protein